MNNTLIVFASRHGTVEKCARHLFRLMDGNADVCNLEERDFLPDISPYNTVIIGGSIHSGSIQAAVSYFCNEKKEELLGKRLGFFINCLYCGKQAQTQLDNAFPPQLKERAIACDYFGGEVNRMKLNFWERIVTSQMIETGDLVVALSQEKLERFAEKMNMCYLEKTE